MWRCGVCRCCCVCRGEISPAEAAPGRAGRAGSSRMLERQVLRLARLLLLACCCCCCCCGVVKQVLLAW